MRRVSVAVIGVFMMVVGMGQLAQSGPLVGVETQDLTIVKTVVGTPPDSIADWEFKITAEPSQDCPGSPIFDPLTNTWGSTATVTIPSSGGQVVVAAAGCPYTVTETPVPGWTTDPDPATFTDVVPPRTLTFTNTLFVSTTTMAPTTTTMAPTTTAATAATTTTIVDVGAGTLPFTGAGRSGVAALVGLAMLTLGAIIVFANRQTASRS